MEDYSQFDNYFLADLTNTLAENSVTERYYPLIDYKEVLKKCLEKQNLMRKNDFDKSVLANFFPQNLIDLFSRFIHIYDFKNRKFNELDFIENETEDYLSANKTTSSFSFLAHCEKVGISTLSKPLVALYQICNLMRLPGVRWVRAKLYYDCGFTTLDTFSERSAQEIQKEIEKFLQENNRPESLPLLKEISTHKAVAKLICNLDKFSR